MGGMRTVGFRVYTERFAAANCAPEVDLLESALSHFQLPILVLALYNGHCFNADTRGFDSCACAAQPPKVPDLAPDSITKRY